MTGRLVVMISGSGSNLQALLDAIDDGRLPAKIVLVVSNRRSAYGLQRAAQAGVEVGYFPLKPYMDAGQSRAAYDADLAARLRPYQPDLIVLAGWMHILSPAFLDQFPDKVINLHPALPGAFPGTEAVARAYAAYQAGEIGETGCMVHYVIPELDAGPVIAQATVPIHPQDSLEELTARMHDTEHKLLVTAVRQALLRSADFAN
jgi:formyltetrahydrofolate-dependent phosphoribosylglycinamide formyltransferase